MPRRRWKGSAGSTPAGAGTGGRDRITFGAASPQDHIIDHAVAPFDRAVRGQVIDYLDLHLRGWHWPAFNIADMAIVGGAIALTVHSLVSTDNTAKAKGSR